MLKKQSGFVPTIFPHLIHMQDACTYSSCNIFLQHYSKKIWCDIVNVCGFIPGEAFIVE